MHKKHVLITGASRGIGAACAFTFASHGYHVFLNCNKSIDALQKGCCSITQQGGTCTLVPGDVGNPDIVRAIFEKIFHHCSRIGCTYQQCRYFLCGIVNRYERRRMDAYFKYKSFFFFLLFPCCNSLHGPAKKGKDYQHFLYVGKSRSFLRSRLFCHKGRDEWAYNGPCKRTGPK